MNSSDGRAARQPSLLASILLWLWRLANTALLAAGVWVLWQHTLQLEALRGELLDLIDYVSVIAESAG
jgi:hypothetical protein